MADVFATISEADEAIQRQLADVLEIRAADSQQRAMLERYLADVAFPRGARVLEVGSGTGAIARVLAEQPGVEEVVGVDPSDVLVDHARERTESPKVTYVLGDGRDLPFADESFDVVVCHTVLCHVPGPELLLDEARRVTIPHGWLAAFDGDYATTTVALHAHDPLQACALATTDAFVHDRYLARRLPCLIRGAGYSITSTRSHGYVETMRPQYMLTIVDRGADALVAAGDLDPATGSALKAEARRRVAAGLFYGHIAYVSVVARLPRFR